MQIQNVSRKFIINVILDKLLMGTKLTKSDIKLLKDMSNGN